MSRILPPVQSERCYLAPYRAENLVTCSSWKPQSFRTPFSYRLRTALLCADGCCYIAYFNADRTVVHPRITMFSTKQRVLFNSLWWLVGYLNDAVTPTEVVWHGTEEMLCTADWRGGVRINSAFVWSDTTAIASAAIRSCSHFSQDLYERDRFETRRRCGSGSIGGRLWRSKMD